jgi:hypothetical protein
MDWTTGLTIAVTVLLAFGGYLATYAYNLKLAQRKDRLERVNKQLSDLYGPLYALVSSSASCWKAFRAQYRPGVPFWGTDPPPTDEEAEAWRLWIVEVFMPLNVAMADVITQNADLLDEPEVPPVLLDICAHVKGYQPIIKRWEAGDFSENSSVINFPRGRIEEFALKEFSRLKEKQRALLGRDT